MKYVNEDNKVRCLELIPNLSVCADSKYINYLKKKGLVTDYINTIIHNRYKYVWINLDEFDIEDRFIDNGNEYVITSSFNNNPKGDALYMIVDPIGDDSNFTWKKNKNEKQLSCTLETLNFEYHIIYDGYGDATISVRYTKGENYHKTKVTIAHIEVENATNQGILDAIKCWKKEFEYDLQFATVA